MRFIVMVKATKETEAGILPNPEEFTAIGKYNAELVKAGVLLAAEGLIAGSSIIQVKSLEEAIVWVKRVQNIFPNSEAEVEIRKVSEAGDFGDAFTPNPALSTQPLFDSMPLVRACHFDPAPRAFVDSLAGYLGR